MYKALLLGICSIALSMPSILLSSRSESTKKDSREEFPPVIRVQHGQSEDGSSFYQVTISQRLIAYKRDVRIDSTRSAVFINGRLYTGNLCESHDSQPQRCLLLTTLTQSSDPNVRRKGLEIQNSLQSLYETLVAPRLHPDAKKEKKGNREPPSVLVEPRFDEMPSEEMPPLAPGITNTT